MILLPDTNRGGFREVVNALDKLNGQLPEGFRVVVPAMGKIANFDDLISLLLSHPAYYYSPNNQSP